MGWIALPNLGALHDAYVDIEVNKGVKSENEPR